MGTANSGHYYSYIRERCGDRRWFEFNDTLVTEFDPADLEAECFGGDEAARYNNNGASPWSRERIRNAFMLVYDRVPEPEAAAAAAADSSSAATSAEAAVQQSVDSSSSQQQQQQQQHEDDFAQLTDIEAAPAGTAADTAAAGADDAATATTTAGAAAETAVVPAVRRASGSRAAGRFRARVPPAIMDEIFIENIEFWRKRNILHEQYYELMAGLLAPPQYGSNAASSTSITTTSSSSTAAAALPLEALQLGVHFVLGTLVQAEETALVRDWCKGRLRELLPSSAAACSWLLDTLAADPAAVPDLCLSARECCNEVIMLLSSVIRADAHHTVAAAVTAAATDAAAADDTAADTTAAAVQLLQNSASRRFVEYLLQLVSLDANKDACEALCFLVFKFIDGAGVAALTVLLLSIGALSQLLMAFAADLSSSSDEQRPHMVRLICRLLRASDASLLHAALVRFHQQQSSRRAHSSDSDDEADAALLQQHEAESPHALLPAAPLQTDAIVLLLNPAVWTRLLRELPARPLTSELGYTVVHLTCSSRAAAALVVEAACAGIAAENAAPGMKPYFRALSVLLAHADTDPALAVWLVPFAMGKLMVIIDQNCEYARPTEAAATLLMRLAKASATVHAWLRSSAAREDVEWLARFLKARDERGLTGAARYMDKQVRRSSGLHSDRGSSSSSGRGRPKSGAAAASAPANTQDFVSMLTTDERMWSYDSDDEPQGEPYC
jgi:hypothetical protein